MSDIATADTTATEHVKPKRSRKPAVENLRLRTFANCAHKATNREIRNAAGIVVGYEIDIDFDVKGRRDGTHVGTVLKSVKIDDKTGKESVTWTATAKIGGKTRKAVEGTRAFAIMRVCPNTFFPC